MNDIYLKFASSRMGRRVARQLRLPQPVVLDRAAEGNVCFSGPTLVGSANRSRFSERILKLLESDGATLVDPSHAGSSPPLKHVIFDASGLESTSELGQLVDFFTPNLRSFGRCTRTVLVALIPDCCPPSQHVVQRSLVGFVKSLAKEMRWGGTVNLLYAHPDCEQSLDAPLAFLASDRSAYVSGQVLNVHPARIELGGTYRSIAGRNILVTGAARGIGQAIAKLLSQRGAKVTCLDVPKAEVALRATADQVGGDWLALDIASQEAPQMIAECFSRRALDGIVHNAGITRDKKLANMTLEMWDSVVRTNLTSQARINDFLLESRSLSEGGRIVLVSSISGIGGNAGQTNYATSKAGVIGMVEANWRDYAQRGISINAVAPGFIETDMVKSIPMVLRQFGRRLNSMNQGGLPQDVAEAVALFLQSNSQGLNGNVLRVCGQALMGA